jgi:hypothetical protein
MSLRVSLLPHLLVVLGLCMSQPAFGNSIVIFNTGESPGGTALPVGQVDPHYSLISAPSGVPLTAITTSPNAAWTPNTGSADWIGPTGSGNLSSPVGN